VKQSSFIKNFSHDTCLKLFKKQNKTLRKIQVIFIVLFLFGISLNPVINSKSIDTGISKEFFRDEIKESFIYINSSNPYDYGLKVGKRFRLQYKLLDIWTGFTKKNKIYKKDIENQINTMKQYCPFFLEELKGLSASLNIELERLLSIMISISHFFDSKCTTTLSTKPATKNNETFLTMNMDSSQNFMVRLLRLYSMKCWIVKITTLKYRYVFLGIPILYEIPLLNENGLGFGGNGLSLTENESRYIDEGPGISTYMLERLTMMTCKNVSEVAQLWKNMERASGTYRDWPHFWDNSISVWCDKEGGILMIEQTHNYIITVFGNSTEITGAPEGILWHANIHQWLDPNLTGSMFPEDFPSSPLRAERAYELLNNNYGNITLDVCKNITRDHGGGSNKNGRDSYDICRHSDKNWSSNTAISWIIQPKDLTVYWTHRSPCRSIFKKHNFTKIFERKN